MVGEPPKFHHVRPMRRRVVVVARDRTSTWRRVVGLLKSGFCPEVDRGTTHMMLGLSAEVEVVVGNVRWKIFLVAARCSDGGGRFM